FPYFKGALEAINGTHIDNSPSAIDCESCHNWKGERSQNCVACCSFNMGFQYMVSGHEGSTNDS
ncbi:hypothetical protein EDD18DRAFT_1056540, partial [Armillaria luteobubalina]